MASHAGPGPIVIYVQYLTLLSWEFFVFPALLLSGRRSEEDIMRKAGLISMCIVIVSDVAWTNWHPQPLSLCIAAAAGVVSVLAQSLHLSLAFGMLSSPVYSPAVARVLMSVMGLSWILVNQVGTAFTVSANQSPARYLILAWITVMVAGCSLSFLPWLRDMPLLLVFLAVTPRLVATASLVMSGLFSVDNGAELKTESSKVTGSAEDDALLTVAVPRALRFAIFAGTSCFGEAFNDIATDLTIRRALSAGDTTLQLAYNGAVLLSMCCGFVSESLAAGKGAAGARRFFSILWGVCQFCRCCGMSYMTQETTRLMFAFVFFDKLTGPLGSAAMDMALLALIRRDGGGHASKPSWRLPANAMWTLRSPAEQLQRTTCQMLLLRFGNVPWWVSMAFTATSVGFVNHTLRPAASDRERQQKKDD